MSVESTVGNNLQKKRQYSIIYFKWYTISFCTTGVPVKFLKTKPNAFELALGNACAFQLSGEIGSCTSFHLSRFMNKFSSWNRYKRPFQIWGVFIISWTFVFFLQISQVHVSARTRTSYPAQLVSILARGFFSPALAESPEHFQFSFDFDLGNIIWPLFRKLQLHSSLIHSSCNFKLLLNTALYEIFNAFKS